MKILLIILLIIAIAIIIDQSFRLRNMKKHFSENKHWYPNDIPRDIKEGFLNKLENELDSKNIPLLDFLEYFEKDWRQLEDIVESIFEKTKISKLYLPKKLEKIVVTDGVVHYPYRIGKTMKIKELLSSYNGSTKEYAYDMGTELNVEILKRILDFNDNFKSRDFCYRFYFFVLIKNDLYITDATWFDLNPMSWWISQPQSINYISDEILDNYIDKGDILFVPKKIT